jgi:alpha-tubulin suppressor-like RCC1 family protein
LKTLLAVLTAVLLLAVPAHASVYSWGQNGNLQLGAGWRSGLEASPVPLRGLPADVIELAEGEGSDAAVTSTGDVWTWGGNLYGQAGVGWPGRPLVAPVKVLSGVRQISAWGADVVALMDDGTVKVWGQNLSGEAGNGTSTAGREVAGMSIPSPQTVPGVSNVVRVAGGASIAAILADGSVEAWGADREGMLGIPGAGYEVLYPTAIPGLSGVKEVAVAPFTNIAGHSLALLENGRVLASGDNSEGALGDGTLVSRNEFKPVHGLPQNIAGVAAGAFSSLAWTTDGRLYAWGPDQLGQLGIGGPGPETCGIHRCATLPVLVPLENVTRAAAGIGYVIAEAGGRLYAWGNGELGELADGQQRISYSPEPIPGMSEVGPWAAGTLHASAVAGVTPTPVSWLTATAGVGSIELSWVAPAGPSRWTVIWGEGRANAIRAGSTTVAPSARSFAISGLKPGRWLVYVNSTAWPHPRVAVATVP